MDDECEVCRQAKAKWIVLDNKKHAYWTLYLTLKLKPSLQRRVEEKAYLACGGCKERITRFNATSKYPRQLRFLPWS